MSRNLILLIAILTLPAFAAAQDNQVDLHVAMNANNLVGQELTGDHSYGMGFTAGLSYLDRPMENLNVRFILEYSFAEYKTEIETRRANLVRPSFTVEYLIGDFFILAGPEASLNFESSKKSESIQRTSVNHEVQTYSGNIVAGLGYHFSRRTAIFGKIHQGFTPYTRNEAKGYFQSLEFGVYFGL